MGPHFPMHADPVVISMRPNHHASAHVRHVGNEFCSGFGCRPKDGQSLGACHCWVFIDLSRLTSEKEFLDAGFILYVVPIAFRLATIAIDCLKSNSHLGLYNIKRKIDG